MMRLLMACSTDGYLCGKVDDDMSWTGAEDKRIFRALTGVGGVCAVGNVTWRMMPSLDGRQVIPLSRTGYDLQRFQQEHPDGWLLGGPAVGHEAMRLDLVSEFHLCVIRGVWLRTGVSLGWMTGWTRWQKVGRLLGGHPPAMETEFDELTLRVYR